MKFLVLLFIIIERKCSLISYGHSDKGYHLTIKTMQYFVRSCYAQLAMRSLHLEHFFHIRSGHITCGPTQTVAKCVLCSWCIQYYTEYICVQSRKQNRPHLIYDHTMC